MTSTAGPSVSTPTSRLAQFDVARGAVLLGVFVMNYIVFFNIKTLREVSWTELDEPGWLRSFLDPQTGPVSTRFAAALATLVGMGVTLLSTRVVASNDRGAISQLRWRLRRRGTLFVVTGIFFDGAWPGTILHFTGVYLILCSFVVTWRRRWWLVGAAGICALTVLQRVVVFQASKDDLAYTSWWGGFRFGSRVPVGTVQGFITNVTTWGGHPILPWLAFVLVGMTLATFNWNALRTYYLTFGVGVALVASGYALQFIGKNVLSEQWRWAASVDPGPFRRTPPFGLGMPAYVVAAVGSSIAVIALVAGFAFRFPRFLPFRVLARAGRVTFSLYILHGLIPWLLVALDVDGQRHGLVPSVLIGCVSWFVAVVAGALWQRRFTIGPLEWVLRKFGG